MATAKTRTTEEPEQTDTEPGGDPVVEPQVATTMYAPNQQCVRADGSGPGQVYASGATAGVPGTWTPAGSTVPTLAGLQAGTPVAVTATPATTWTVGQYVQTATAGVPGRAYRHATNGWVQGAAP
jgi:hypothetical protein